MTTAAGPMTTVPVTSADGLVIETTGLTKRLGGRAVVDGIDLAVPEGSVFGFLGPNGSGKTTTIRMLLGLAFASAGQVRVLGQEIPALASRALPQVGALVEGPAFYPWLSGEQNLARLDQIGPSTDSGTRSQRIDTALARVGLGAAAKKRFRAYSLGMRQRLGLAAALVRPCRLLILDEPTNGLDPQGTREVRALVREMATEGTTVFLSSHLLSEVEQVCTHAAVMRVGHIVAQGPMEALRATQQRLLKVETPDLDMAVKVLASLDGVGLSTSSDGLVKAELCGVLPEVCASALVGAGVRVRSLTSEVPSLEDMFVALTGEGFDVAE